jgi:hypothetical protein
MNDTEKEILTRSETASLLNISLVTLGRINIPRSKVRRRVYYLRESIMNFLKENEKTSC